MGFVISVVDDKEYDPKCRAARYDHQIREICYRSFILYEDVYSYRYVPGMPKSHCDNRPTRMNSSDENEVEIANGGDRILYSCCSSNRQKGKRKALPNQKMSGAKHAHAFIAFLNCEAKNNEERAKNLRDTANAIEAKSFSMFCPCNMLQFGR